ncbi:Hypothetical_protein [Hexamita inflata]|uniref:Hypothetical_protein n=1 Tax=Hexamita inflata TaxID=28002 RepID=A0AA86RGG7_9EUKA|nr:Hypothetical protein HINF_LOCUS61361 [Hexamita inflata]
MTTRLLQSEITKEPNASSSAPPLQLLHAPQQLRATPSSQLAQHSAFQTATPRLLETKEITCSTNAQQPVTRAPQPNPQFRASTTRPNASRNAGTTAQFKTRQIPASQRAIQLPKALSSPSTELSAWTTAL